MSPETEETYKGDMTSYNEIQLWADKCCIPLVREITFENAEEITEEGLPLIILFHKRDDIESVRRFKIACAQIRAERSRINFLHANAHMFTHPLEHLGKTLADLPMLAIDSFRHMYLFPDQSQLYNPDAIESFIEDLYTGTLHRIYHNLPIQEGTQDPHTKPKVPHSSFVHLQPSKHRYSRHTDEL